jgi:hypothetical protein
MIEKHEPSTWLKLQAKKGLCYRTYIWKFDKPEAKKTMSLKKFEREYCL